MAGDWIKWCKGLASRREVVILSRILKRDRHEIAARLMVLWEWCDENVSENDVDKVSLNVSLILGDSAAQFLDDLLGIDGMSEAMASDGVRWIEFRESGIVVFPNLGRHNGTSAKTRAYEARKKSSQRLLSRKCPENVPKMSRKNGDKIGTREEKRRDIQYQNSNSGIDAPSETKPAKQRSRREFVPPTLDDVQAYVAERGSTIDPELFWNHYEANGWVQGNKGKPVANWKACLVTWEKNEHERAAGKRTGNARTGPGQLFDSASEPQGGIAEGW